MKTAKSKAFSALSALVCLAAAYFLLVCQNSGMAVWLLGLPAAAIVATTALVRGNEIPVELHSWRSHLRRAGFLFASIGAVGFVVSPFGPTGSWPSARGLFMLWGMASTWLTTPNMPPWWDYITGKKKLLRKDVA